jgi:arylesterase / paraoxonase
MRRPRPRRLVRRLAAGAAVAGVLALGGLLAAATPPLHGPAGSAESFGSGDSVPTAPLMTSDAGPLRVLRCTPENSILGAEDITIDASSGIALISADNRHKKRLPYGGDKPANAVYAYDLAAPDPRPRDLTSRLKLGFPFHPHGIGLWTGPDGERRLFVVNHRPKHGSTIEIFRFDGETLQLIESVPPHPDVHQPNDLVPVGPRSFYVTNNVGSRSAVGQALEGLLGQAKSYVLFYDGSGYRRVAEGLRYANGVNVSHDGRTVFVTTTRGKEVLLYRREADGGLTHRRTIPVETGADNLEIDEHGHLWIGAHPSLFAFVRYALTKRGTSPSQVIRIPYRGGDYGAPEEVFRDDGRLLPGSSVAAVHGSTLLVGSVFDGFLVCDLGR